MVDTLTRMKNKCVAVLWGDGYRLMMVSEVCDLDNAWKDVDGVMFMSADRVIKGRWLQRLPQEGNRAPRFLLDDRKRLSGATLADVLSLGVETRKVVAKGAAKGAMGVSDTTHETLMQRVAQELAKRAR